MVFPCILVDEQFSALPTITSPLQLERLSVSSSVEGAEAPLRAKTRWNARHFVGASRASRLVVYVFLIFKIHLCLTGRRPRPVQREPIGYKLCTKLALWHVNLLSHMPPHASVE